MQPIVRFQSHKNYFFKQLNQQQSYDFVYNLI